MNPIQWTLVATASAFVALLLAYPRWQARRHRREPTAPRTGALPVDGHLSHKEAAEAIGIEECLELNPPPGWHRLAARMETRSSRQGTPGDQP